MKITTLPAAAALILGALAPGSAVPISQDQSAACRRAEALGRAIYDQDVASAKATDALTAKVDLKGVKGLKGWITIRNAADTWLVRFIGEREGALLALYDVNLGTDGTCTVVPRDPPSPLGERDAAMFRARQAALAAMSDPCEGPYNTVVLPQEAGDGDGWLVYLLATSDKNEIVLGGHFRAYVTADGTHVRRIERLTNDCNRGDLTEARATGSEPEAVMTTHHASPTPNEAHVFINLLHKMPIVVGTELGMWSVSDGHIRFESEWPKGETRPEAPD